MKITAVIVHSAYSPPRLGGVAARINVSRIARRRGGRSMTRSLLIDAREALHSIRCASRISIRRLRVIDRPPRRARSLAASPPNLGGETPAKARDYILALT